MKINNETSNNLTQANLEETELFPQPQRSIGSLQIKNALPS